MNTGKTIYITSPEAIADSDWISAFVDKLKMAVSRTSKTSFKWNIKRAETSDYNALLAESDIFITLLDADENKDEKYSNELNSIASCIEKEKTANTNSKRLYKVLRSPDNVIDQPDIFKNIASYEMFEYHGRKENPKPIDFSNKEQNIKAWNLILDLAYNIKESIDNLQNINEQNSSVAKNVVYLSMCSSDISGTRDEIKRELQNLDIEILPKTNLNHSLDEFDQVVNENIKQSNFIIQLLGKKYGTINKKHMVSLVEKESSLISEALKENKDITRLIWSPESKERKEPKQDLFINRLKQKVVDDKTEFVESSVNDLKDILLHRLSITDSETDVQKTESKVYLIAPAQPDLSELEQLAAEENINIATIDFSDQEKLYQQHLNYLSQTDNILVLYIKEDSWWLKSKMNDIIKAPGMGRKTPFRSVGIIINGPSPQIDEFRKWMPDIETIQYNNKEEIIAFLKKIKE